MIDIDKIALEVAKAYGQSSIQGADHIAAFAKAFLARVDQERAKAGAVAWLYDFETDEAVVTDWLSSDYDESHSPTMGCTNIRPLYLSPTLPEGLKAVHVEPPDAFSSWVECNMPSGTVIADPQWWVSRLYKAMLAATPEVPK